MQLLLLPLLAIMSSSQAQADTIVRMSHGPQAPRWAEVEETLSVGLLDEDPDYNFFGVSGLAIGKDGSFVVLEAGLQVHTPQLRMYDAEGRFIRHMGRVGQGPGEFVRPSRLTSMPDGRYLLADLIQGRMLVYSAEGHFEESWRVPFRQLGLGFWVSPTGTVAMLAGGSQEQRWIVRLATGGEVIDSLPEPDLPELAQTLIISNPPVRSVLRAPYMPRSTWAWHPDGFFITARTDRYAIDLRLPSPGDGSLPPVWREGDPVVSIRAEVSPVAIDPEERRDQQRYLDQSRRAAEGVESGSLDPVPSVKPIIRAIRPADDGRVWVHLYAESERVPPESWTNPRGERIDFPQWQSTFVWDVFELDGTYLGRVPLPPLVRTRFRGDEVWGFTSRELGVPVLKRYRIRWPTPG